MGEIFQWIAKRLNQRASLIAQLVKNLPAIQETAVRFLGWERTAGEGTGYPLQYSWASLVAQLVNSLLAVKETWIWFLGWDDPLEKGKATHSKYTSLVAQTIKCMPTFRETRVQSLGWEDLLEKKMATHSSILAWKIPWMEEPGRLQSMG